MLLLQWSKMRLIFSIFLYIGLCPTFFYLYWSFNFFAYLCGSIHAFLCLFSSLSLCLCLSTHISFIDSFILLLSFSFFLSLSFSLTHRRYFSSWIRYWIRISPLCSKGEVFYGRLYGWKTERERLWILTSLCSVSIQFASSKSHSQSDLIESI